MKELTCDSGSIGVSNKVDVAVKPSNVSRNSGSRRDIALSKSLFLIASVTAWVC